MKALNKKEKIFKQSIIDYLESKNAFEKIDLELLDQLIFVNRVIRQSQADIEKRGLMVNIAGSQNPNKTYLQKNPFIGTLEQYQKLAIRILEKLGLNAADRIRLKMQALNREEMDDFGKDFEM